jgi:hypothetical protein
LVVFGKLLVRTIPVEALLQIACALAETVGIVFIVTVAATLVPLLLSQPMEEL